MEVVITIAIFIILIFGVSAMLNDIFVNSSQELSSMDNIDQARSAAFAFSNEIRNAATGSNGSYPLNQASDSQIIFFTSYKTNNSAVKRIRYYVSGDILYKGVVLPTGNPLNYDLSSETITPVIAGVTNGNSPAFYYYDGNYDGNTNALVQPVNINQVRFIKISLSVLKKSAPDETETFQIESGAAVRSVKNNLGN